MRRTSSRPLTEPQRRSAFAVAGALVLAAAIALGALAPSRHSHPTTGTPPAAAHTPPRIVDVTGTRGGNPAQAAAPLHKGPAARTQPTSSEQQRIDRDARTFLSAYLAYEVGPLDATARSELDASATRALARRLIEHPVDLPPRDRPAVGHVQSLALSGGSGRGSITIAATIKQAGWGSGLTLTLERAHGRWLVSRVT